MTFDSGLLTDLYGAVEDESRWLVVLDQLKAQLGVQSAVAQVLSSARPCLQEMWTARDSYSLSNALVHDAWVNSAANPRFQYNPVLRIDGSVCSDYKIGLSDGELFMMRDRLGQFGLGPAFWIGFSLDESTQFSLVFHRSYGDNRDIGATEEGLLQQLLPHLRQAVRLWQRVSDTDRQVSALEQIGRAVTVPILICDRRLRVAWHNPAASALLAHNPHLVLRADMLVPSNPRDGERLRGFIAHVARGGADLLALGAAGDDPLHIRALSRGEPGGDAPEREDALLAIAAPERLPYVRQEDLMHLLGLTQAEAQLAAMLVAGGTVNDFAEERRVTLGTARIQLKHLMGKTGSRRQADLVRLVLNSLCARSATRSGWH